MIRSCRTGTSSFRAIVRSKLSVPEINALLIVMTAEEGYEGVLRDTPWEDFAPYVEELIARKPDVTVPDHRGLSLLRCGLRRKAKPLILALDTGAPARAALAKQALPFAKAHKPTRIRLSRPITIHEESAAVRGRSVWFYSPDVGQLGRRRRQRQGDRERDQDRTSARHRAGESWSHAVSMSDDPCESNRSTGSLSSSFSVA